MVVQTLHVQTVGQKLLTVVQLQTLINEIESVLNTRPLVYVANDINSTMPIIPAHFLKMNPKSGIPTMRFRKIAIQAVRE